MAASSVTYTELSDAVADRADIAVSATGRHTPAKMQARINRSLKAWNRLLIEAGDDTNLQVARVSTNPSATIANNWAPRQYIVQPAGLEVIRGIDIYRSGSTQPIAMTTFSEAERNDPSLGQEWWMVQNTGFPLFYRLGGTIAAEAYIIQIYPWANAVYTCDIRYIPSFPPALTGTAYDFVLGGEEYVICDAAMQCLITDGRAGTPEFAGIAQIKAETEQAALVDLARRGVVRRRDTWLERRVKRWNSRWRDL